MSKEERQRMTFAALDREKGVPESSPAVDEEHPLPAWYRAVRETPLDELAVEDISRALRQQIHPEYVVPIALRLLQTDPLAGEIYDGEIFASLKGVARNYWPAHVEHATELRAIIEKVLSQPSIAEDIRRDADELRDRARLTQ